MMIIERLRSLDFGLPPEAWSDLDSELELLKVPKGQVLMQEGAPGDSVFFVLTGHLRAFVGREGAEIGLGSAGPGESIGEMALLSGERRMASVRAEEDCEVVRLMKGGFDRTLDAHPKAMAAFAKVMASRLARSARSKAVVAQIRATPFVSQRDCRDAVDTHNPVMLNLKITQLYHRIAVDLTTLLGIQDVNWFGFACRASKTAGYSIRGEEFPMRSLFDRLRKTRGLGAAVNRLEQKLSSSFIARKVSEALDTVADRVAEGNRLIFSEIGPVFVGLVEQFAGDRVYDQVKLDRYLSTLKPGPSDQGGQDTLRDAVRAYYEASFESNPKKRAELILLGSLRIGQHEQIRVDPIISEALDAPTDIVVRGLFGDIFSNKLLAKIITPINQEVKHQLTRHVMSIRLPHADLSLGQDVPDVRGARFPDMLTTLANPDLSALIRKWDPEAFAGGSSHAADWSRLEERMRYIARLFRTRQKSLELFEPPYLLAQSEDIQASQLPAGDL